MIICLYGADSYRRQEKLKWYAEKFKEKHSALTAERFTLSEDGELARLKEFAAAQSLFDNFKFGVLDEAAEADSKELAEVLKLALNSRNLTLVISAEKFLPKEFKILNDSSVIKEEFDFTPSDLAGFLKKEAEKRNLKLIPAVSDILIKNCGGDKWWLVTELDKLALGSPAAIEPVREDQNFFGLINKFRNADSVGYALPALERLLDFEEPAKIFNMISSFAKASEDLRKMADYDAAIKSGKMEYPEALLDLALGD